MPKRYIARVALVVWLGLNAIGSVAVAGEADEPKQAASAPSSAASDTPRLDFSKTLKPEEVKKQLANKSVGTCKATAGSSNSSAVDCSWNAIKHYQEIDDGTIQARNDAWSLTAHLPISAGESTATIGDLDGLARSYTLGAGVGMIQIISPENTILYGLSVKGGPQPHTWYSPTTLASTTGDRPSASGSAYVGTTVGEYGRGYILLRQQVAHTFSDAKSKSLCLQAAEGTPMACANGSIGPPTSKHTSVTTLKGTRAVGPDDRPYVLSLSFSRDWRNHVSGAKGVFDFYQWGQSAQSTPLVVGVELNWTNDPAVKQHFGAALAFSTTSMRLIATGED